MKALTLFTLITFAVQPREAVAADSVCSSGFYGALAPLYSYDPAVTYCKGQAGKATVTVTASGLKKRATSTSSDAAARKASTTTTKKTTTTTTKKSTITTTTKKSSTTTTTKSSTTTSAKDSKASQWSSLVAQAQSVVATFCSCAGYPATVTTTVTPTPTSTTPPPPAGPTCNPECSGLGCGCYFGYPSNQPVCGIVVSGIDCAYYIQQGINYCTSFVADDSYCVIAPGQGGGESQSACAIPCQG